MDHLSLAALAALALAGIAAIPLSISLLLTHLRAANQAHNTALETALAATRLAHANDLDRVLAHVQASQYVSGKPLAVVEQEFALQRQQLEVMAHRVNERKQNGPQGKPLTTAQMMD